MRQRECVGYEVQNCTDSDVPFFGKRLSTPIWHAPPGSVDASRSLLCIASKSTVTYRTAKDGSRSNTLQYCSASPASPPSSPSAVLKARCGQSSILPHEAEDVWNATVLPPCSSPSTQALASDMNLAGCCATFRADETVTCAKYESPVTCSKRARFRYAFGLLAA